MTFLRHLGLVAVVLCAGCASELRTEKGDPSIDGAWQGVFSASTTDEKGALISFPVHLRLIINGGTAQVYARDSAEAPWVEQDDDQPYVVDVRGPNALIYANRAGQAPGPEGSRWYEVYLVLVTLKSTDQLLVHWVRMVNNVDTAIDHPDHAGVSAGDGILTRRER